MINMLYSLGFMVLAFQLLFVGWLIAKHYEIKRHECNRKTKTHTARPAGQKRPNGHES
jgi:hypothetical protein